MIPSVTYTEPTLCTYDMDMSQAWFVYFDITNELTGITLRRQFRGGINYWKNKEDRIRTGRALVKFWKDKLQTGLYNPFKMELANPVEHPANLRDAVLKVLELKKSSIKSKTYSKYNEVSRMFLEWCSKFSYDKLRIFQFGSDQAQAYLDYLLIQRTYSGKSHNNQLGVLKAFFNVMTNNGRKWIIENPFVDIAELPEDVGNNHAYTDKERDILKNYFLEHDKRMYYATNFLFHGFIRKTELCSIRVGDIDWDNKTIMINSREAKNRIQDSVTISEGFMSILYEMGLDLAPSHYYIFGRGMETCEKRCARPDDISDRHLQLKLAAGLTNFNKDGKAFYSWKHTGVVAYWKVVKDIYFMMRQLRHHDMKVTMIYLKSLGLMPNEAFRDAKIVL